MRLLVRRGWYAVIAGKVCAYCRQGMCLLQVKYAHFAGEAGTHIVVFKIGKHKIGHGFRRLPARYPPARRRWTQKRCEKAENRRFCPDKVCTYWGQVCQGMHFMGGGSSVKTKRMRAFCFSLSAGWPKRKSACYAVLPVKRGRKGSGADYSPGNEAISCHFPRIKA